MDAREREVFGESSGSEIETSQVFKDDWKYTQTDSKSISKVR